MNNLTAHCRVKDGNGRDSGAPALAGTRTRSESDVGDRHSILMCWTPAEDGTHGQPDPAHLRRRETPEKT
jgi:hypothetical protein